MRSIVAAIVVAFLLGGCSGVEDVDHGDVVATLVDAGSSVDETGIAEWGPFSAPAHRLVVDGHDVWVYEYPDVDAREQEAATILMKGWSVNHTPVEWIGSPHYWLRGRVIVLYLGDDVEAIETLTSAMGPQLDLSGVDGVARFRSQT